ncbi:hypothetical protein [Achromobacter sp. UMC71]|uniref:hypothetical protein n=1 Tax=Achromobacter sp. UMC71 TaxID=1862320 RepID=UPI0016023E12|nr:hypothetical protein [Achromobacter sp. UMC71]
MERRRYLRVPAAFSWACQANRDSMILLAGGTVFSIGFVAILRHIASLLARFLLCCAVPEKSS